MRIYTDASTKKDLSGLAYIATNRHHEEIKKRATAIDQSDNNTAELQAIIYAIDETQPLLQKNEKAIIFTDSTYAINAIRRNHYRPDEEPLVKKIQSMMEYGDYYVFWLKGHNQDGTVLSYFNGKVDTFAKQARVKYEQILEKRKRQSNAFRKGKNSNYER